MSDKTKTVRTFGLGARVLWTAKVGGKNVKRTAFVIKVGKDKVRPYTVETIEGEKYTPAAALLTTKRGRRPAKYAALGNK